MRKSICFLFTAISLFYCKEGAGHINLFNRKITQSLNSALTDNDRKNYIVTISQTEISKPESTSNDSAFPSKLLRISFWLKVNNNSNDTLKYLNKTCSWADILKVDNEKLHINKNYCTTDVTKIDFVPPHKTVAFNITITYNKTKVSPNLPFKVGIEIIKYVNKKQFLLFDASKNQTVVNTANLIWSNKVVIPQ